MEGKGDKRSFEILFQYGLQLVLANGENKQD
jgi:hypothetical protein